MGIRLHRGIGWGMPIEKFNSLCLEKFDDEGDDLWSRFADLKYEDMIIPREDLKGSFGHYMETNPAMPFVGEPVLLSKVFTSFGKDALEVDQKDRANGYELVSFVNIGDEDTDIIFYPGAYYANKWHSYDDDIAYAFERWRYGGSKNADPDPRDFVIYVDYGHYPYTNSIMNKDGTPREWDHFVHLKNDDTWVPAVPYEIRWYLTKMRLLDDAAINELRPMIAQWWC
ncbi:hypothetical protein phiOC_p332 [Ochrobactrum phage vB_OspM_OC]|nr:hypothetical protein phiOC_p332 [Ochrobactrum phage vB_OspM_OC]